MGTLVEQPDLLVRLRECRSPRFPIENLYDTGFNEEIRGLS